ncbi:MAG: GldG family protein [Candidatus Firestonebacteria bacterium]|nr:GldG family protein [Candidatus Firestonebacteria bacterium]
MEKITNRLKKIIAAVKKLTRNRNIKYGSVSVSVIILILGSFWFASKILSNFDLKYDVTENKKFSLSPQTVKIFKELKGDVRFTLFVRRGHPYERMMGDLLRNLEKVSSKVKVRILDVDMNKAEATAYKITDYNTTVIELGAQRKDLMERDVVNFNSQDREFLGEQGLVNAVLALSVTGKKVICFTEGHKEKDINDSSNISGYGLLKQLLLNDNYEVRSINIIRTGNIPEDCSVLVVAGPQISFGSKETELVGKYMEKGGKAVFLFEPFVVTGFEALLENWGLRPDNDFVIDPKYYLNIARVRSDPGAPIPEWEKHSITEPLKKSNIPVFFPSSRSISELARKQGRAYLAAKLITTSNVSWGETDLQSLKVEPGPKKDAKDLKGPLTLGWAVVEYKSKEPAEAADISKQLKFVIIGDSDFAANAPSGIAGMQGNLDFFMNSVNWLLDEKGKISIRPKAIDIRTLQSLNKTQWAVMYIMTIIVAPLLVLGAGVFVFLKRRKK